MANKVRFGKGVTINIGYESVRLDLELEVVVKQGESYDDAYDRAKDWVDNKLLEEEQIIRRGGGRR